jgi:predicted DNA-binding transcriptional regulator AlpA
MTLRDAGIVPAQHGDDYMSIEHAPRRVRSLRETAELAGISLATLRRQIAEGTGPTVTRLSARRVGVRDDHRQEWLDRCAESREAA